VQVNVARERGEGVVVGAAQGAGAGPDLRAWYEKTNSTQQTKEKKPKKTRHKSKKKNDFSLSTLFVQAFICRFYSVIRFESVIHEFDPWFNYRATQHLVKDGLYDFLNWFDDRAWYPLGRIVGGTVYPGLMLTSGLAWRLLHALNLPVHIREVCVFIIPWMASNTTLAAYFLASEVKDSSAGLLAAAFIGIVPGVFVSSFPCVLSPRLSLSLCVCDEQFIVSLQVP
jgi:asparagine N-glycosylation enzyme membrane subunit Stt3